MPAIKSPLDQFGNPLIYRQRHLGASFLAANQAAVTFGVGLSATLATFGINNPAGSLKNLVIKDIQIALSAAPAGAVVFYAAIQPSTAAAAPSGVTPLTARPTIIGSSAVAIGVPMTVATLGAVPVIARILGAITGALALTPPVIDIPLDGDIILLPQTQLVIQASAAAAGFISAVWEEVDP